jgi:hypothetical protein
MKKLLLYIVTVATSVVLLAGCNPFNSDDGENFFSKTFNSIGDKITNMFGEDSLTEKDALQGSRTFSEDGQSGMYEAEYQQFSGREILFDSTSLEEHEKDTLQISYAGNIDNGNIEVYWTDADSEKHLLFEADGEQTETVELQGGWEYLSVEGDDLEGDIRIGVQ